jgi:hypothetical protein
MRNGPEQIHPDESRHQMKIVRVDERLIPNRNTTRALRAAGVSGNVLAATGAGIIALEKGIELITDLNSGEVRTDDPLGFAFKISAVIAVWVAGQTMNDLAEGRTRLAREIEAVNSGETPWEDAFPDESPEEFFHRNLRD